MNLLLLFPEDFLPSGDAVLRGRRLAHLREIRDCQVGDTLTAGLVNGDIGVATLTAVDSDSAMLRFHPERTPPPALPARLVIALPRPKMVKRILQTAATMGVKDIHFINAYKVEKSFWSSPWLGPEKCHENLVLGLEQGVDTVMPTVHRHTLFKPFVEDILPGLITGTTALLGHPEATTPCPWQLNAPTTLVIGPEGGFTPYENGKLQEAGCLAVSLGPRILRVETAVPVLLGRLYGTTTG